MYAVLLLVANILAWVYAKESALIFFPATYVYLYTCIYIRIYTYIYIHVYIHIYICIYMYIYVYIYMYMPSSRYLPMFCCGQSLQKSAQVAETTCVYSFVHVYIHLYTGRCSSVWTGSNSIDIFSVCCI